jgi:hypothetical protein
LTFEVVGWRSKKERETKDQRGLYIGSNAKNYERGQAEAMLLMSFSFERGGRVMKLLDEVLRRGEGQSITG